jgi:hypothetical protein
MRQRIEGTKALEKLVEYVEADPKESIKIMTAHQATVALALLKKVSPDLSSQTLKVEVDNRPARLMKRAHIESELEFLRNDERVIEHAPLAADG